jgi:hypothetical protein
VIDLTSTIFSQWANAPVILELLAQMNEDIDPRANFDAFYDQVWNIDTAEGYGLDLWGRIVGVGRTFATDSGPVTLEDNDYRTLILVKAMANITNCSAPSLNRLVTALFGAFGRCYVQKAGTMAMRYVFEFIPTDIQRAIVRDSGAMPAPTGVLVDFLFFDPATTFGFAGSGLQPWNQGVFFSGVTYAP